jgi:precorrin-2 dehydrogenase / sirohydrochlorin ferrochelatase
MPPSLLPIFVKLAARPCLVVGAGDVAATKISALIESGAWVTAVAPHANQQVLSLSRSGAIVWRARKFTPSDLDGVSLAIAATSDSAVNRAVFLECRRRGILCNSVDDPPNCDFFFSAVVRRGDLQIAVSTAGESPAIAQRFKEEIDELLDDCVGDWLRLVGQLRRKIIAAQPPSKERNRLLRLLAYSEFCEADSCAQHGLSTSSSAHHLHLPEAPQGTGD